MNKENFYNNVNRLLLEASETNEFLKLLDQIYQKKRGENYPERTKDDNFYRQLVLDIAKSVGFQPQSTDLIHASNSARQYMLKPENLNKIEREQPQTSATNQAEDVPKKKWPGYNEFRRKWYKQTVDLGWPKNLKSPYKDSKTEDGIVYPWGPFNTAYIFNNRGNISSFKSYTGAIKDYLYSKFEKNVNGLKKLSEKVESIVELEKKYLNKKSTSFMSNIALSIFKGLGASASDEAFLKWVSKKFTGMTVFEYQQMILDEMYSKMSITDTTSEALKNMITSLYNSVKKSEGFTTLYTLDQIKTEYSRSEDEFIAYFDVKTRSGARDKYSAYVFMLDTLARNLVKKKYNSNSRRDLSASIDEAELDSLIASIKAPPANFKDADILQIINNKDVEFEMEDIQGRNNNVLGTYKISILYIVNGCRVQVSYKPEV